jgi:4-hydroxybenzoate polyprenyltransferase
MSEARDWLQILRCSNIGTIISNVLVGSALAGVAYHDRWGSELVAPRRQTAGVLFLAMIVLAAFYLGGMVLNDAADADRDCANRPERPIPRGEIDRRTAWWTGFAFVAAGGALAATSGMTAALIGIAMAVAVIAYTLLHQYAVAGVVLMATCRGLVYLLAAAIMFSEIAWTEALMLAGGLAFYAAIVTVVAKHEASDQSSMRFLPAATLLAAAIPAAALTPSTAVPWVVATLLLFTLWIGFVLYQRTTRPADVGDAVNDLLAGFCLLDVVYLVALDEPALAVVAAICFVLTVAAHRRLSGT